MSGIAATAIAAAVEEGLTSELRRTSRAVTPMTLFLVQPEVPLQQLANQALVWTPQWKALQFDCGYPTGVWGDHKHPPEESIALSPTRTGRRTGSHSSGRVYPVHKPHGSGCVGEPVCQHNDMSAKCIMCQSCFSHNVCCSS